MKILTRMFVILLLFVSCSDTGGGHSNIILSPTDLSNNADNEPPDIVPWTPEPDTSGPECTECKFYFCPPLDSVWQKEICMNICDDPPTLVSETECVEYMECDPTQFLIESQDCVTEDGYPGTQDKVCNKGKIQYTDCTSTCVEESCNGIDDDCDSVIDEEQKNACDECGIVPAEVCDDIDNDCDGDTDEDLFQTCTTACGTGYEFCNEGNWISCTAPQPKLEICDGIDNDCDGQIDEDLECICTVQDVGTLFPCTESPLLCGQGYKTCECKDAACTQLIMTECYALCYWVPNVDPTDVCDPLIGMALEEEKCNNFDDNCNQLIDEELTAGCYTGPAGTIMTGICLPGEMICEEGSWGNLDEGEDFIPGYCKDEITPQEEICNGVDDDCDGIVDFGSEIKETDVLFIVDWSGSMTDEINAVLVALNQFANNFSDEEVLQWAVVKGPAPDPAASFYKERLEIVQNITGFSDFLSTMANLDTSSLSMNGMREMLLDAIYLSVSNISTSLVYAIADLEWLGVVQPTIGSQVTESSPPLQDFAINWREGAERIIIVFSDENPQSYLVPKLVIDDVNTAVSATPQLKLYTFSRSGADQHQWEQIAVSGNGEWYKLSNNPTEMYSNLMQILNEACMPGEEE